MKLSSKDVIALMVALSLAGILYIHPLVFGKVLIDKPTLVDVSFNLMPLVHWVGDAYRRGEFPLWNPHSLCGLPQLAYTHSGGLYPVTILLFSLLPYLYAGSLYIIFHGLCAVFLFYLVLREMGVSRVLSSMGSVVVISSGLPLGALYWYLALASLNGVLLLWLGFRLLSRKASLKFFLISSLAIFWAGLAGENELLIYGIAGMLFMSIFGFGDGLNGWHKRILVNILSIALASLVLCALIFPVMEMIKFSVRGPFFPEKIRAVSLTRLYFLILPSWLLPLLSVKSKLAVLAFNSGLSPLYQGFIVPALLILALVSARKDPEQRLMGIIVIALVIYIISKEWEPARNFFSRIPILGSMEELMKALYFAQVMILAMSFRFLSRLSSREDIINERVLLGIALLLSGILVLIFQRICLGGIERYIISGLAVAIGLFAIIPGRFKTLLSNKNLAFIAGALLLTDCYFLAFRHIARTDPERFQLSFGLKNFAHSIKPHTRYAIFEELLTENLDADSPVWGLFEIESKAGNILGPHRVAPGRAILYFAQLYKDLIYTDKAGQKLFNNWTMSSAGTLDMGKIHLLDLAGASIIISRDTAVPQTSPYSLLRPYAFNWKRLGGKFKFGPDEDYIIMDSPSSMEGVLASIPGDRLRVSLEIDKNKSAGEWIVVAKSSREEESEILFSKYVAEDFSQEFFIPLSSFSAKPGNLKLAFLSGMDVSGNLKLKGLEIVNGRRRFQRMKEFGKVEVFYNQFAFPRAFIVRNAVVVSGWQNVANWISSPLNFSPAHYVVLEQKVPEIEILKQFSQGFEQIKISEKVNILEYGATKVEMQAQLLKPGFLVFTDAYFPGWKAYVRKDGFFLEKRILPADLAFRAIFLEKGFNQIRWIYKPISFEIGLWTSLATIISIIAIVLLKKLQKPSDPMSPDLKRI